jgi:hypothetical protein
MQRGRASSRDPTDDLPSRLVPAQLNQGGGIGKRVGSAAGSQAIASSCG